MNKPLFTGINTKNLFKIIDRLFKDNKFNKDLKINTKSFDKGFIKEYFVNDHLMFKMKHKKIDKDYHYKEYIFYKGKSEYKYYRYFYYLDYFLEWYTKEETLKNNKSLKEETFLKNLKDCFYNFCFFNTDKNPDFYIDF